MADKLEKINDFIFTGDIGEKWFASGNEAIARGAFEAGVVIGAGHPGYPATEILENLALFRDQAHNKYNIEWSVNEKVAFEIALAGSMCNARSIAVMKHIGVNVAADSVMTGFYVGALGGMVLISADDPSLHNSQTEQDNRYYGLHGLVPIFEPSSVAEAKDMIKFAFDFSEKFESIVIFRTTTELNYSKGEIILDEATILNRDYHFDETQRARWTNLPTGARVNRVKLVERLKKISEYAEEFPFNQTIIQKDAKIGIISSGMPYSRTVKALQKLNCESQISLLKLGMVYPFPKQSLKDFMGKIDTLVIIEELEPIFESYIKSLAFEENIGIKIHGKDLFQEKFEISQDLIEFQIDILLNLKQSIKKPLILTEIPLFAPKSSSNQNPSQNLHENVYQAIENVKKSMKVNLICCGDVGCDTFGSSDPSPTIDNCVAIGASVGVANGIAKLTKGVVIAVLEDNSFYHTGLSGLINAIYNKNDIIVIICSSKESCDVIRTTSTEKIDFNELFSSLGLTKEFYQFPNSNNQNEIEDALKIAIKQNGVRIIVPTRSETTKGGIN
jgi:indolepyruvate ferredoxin oxidoreductase, alpha subunit